eukprot:jgi/Undpi1/9146/HiC_scaffold_26.g11604.m1
MRYGAEYSPYFFHSTTPHPRTTNAARSLGYCPPNSLKADATLPSWIKGPQPSRRYQHQHQHQQRCRGRRRHVGGGDVNASRNGHGRLKSAASCDDRGYSGSADRKLRGRNYSYDINANAGAGGEASSHKVGYKGQNRNGKSPNGQDSNGYMSTGYRPNGQMSNRHISNGQICSGYESNGYTSNGVGNGAIVGTRSSRRRKTHVTSLGAQRVAGGGGGGRGGGLTAEQEKIRAAHRARAAAKPQAPPKPQVLPPPNTQALNVVLTHAMADFDSLAAAVGLAKLWQDERPDDECCVCIPRGTHPVVKRFLALHKNLFPIKALKDMDQNRVFRVGLVDAQRLDRVGAAATLISNATEVHVVDHHVEQSTDINATTLIIEKVGSVSTIITELLQARGLQMEEAEATLLALGVHSDTGSLTFDSATARDAVALAWLMEQGSSQQAIAEYGHAALSPEQQGTLTECINNLNRTSLNGATVSTAIVQLDSYVNGMAAVAQNVLDVTDSDVFMLGAHFPQKLGRDPTHMVLIGRARPRVSAVNLDALMAHYGGGGHRKAAAASLRLDASTLPGGEPATAESIMQDLVDRIFVEQIKDLEVAENIMTAPVQTCGPTETVDDIAKVLSKHDIRGMPVVDDTGKVVGLISYKEVEKTTRLGRQHELVKGWMREQFVTADVGDPLHEVEEMFIKEDLGRLPVVRDGKLVGLITRADMLRQHRFYDGLHYHNRAFATPVDSPVRRMLAGLRKTLKKYDAE